MKSQYETSFEKTTFLKINLTSFTYPVQLRHESFGHIQSARDNFGSTRA